MDSISSISHVLCEIFAAAHCDSSGHKREKKQDRSDGSSIFGHLPLVQRPRAAMDLQK